MQELTAYSCVQDTASGTAAMKLPVKAMHAHTCMHGVRVCIVSCSVARMRWSFVCVCLFSSLLLSFLHFSFPVFSSLLSLLCSPLLFSSLLFSLLFFCAQPICLALRVLVLCLSSFLSVCQLSALLSFCLAICQLATVLVVSLSF